MGVAISVLILVILALVLIPALAGRKPNREGETLIGLMFIAEAILAILYLVGVR